MGLYDTSSVTTTNLNTELTKVSINPQDTDSYTFYSCNWSKWHAYYREVGRVSAVIDKVSVWAGGKGIKAKEASRQKQIDAIRGCGKDTARDIAINLMRVMSIGGDAYAEIIKNDRGELKNLKPLNSGTMENVTNDKGMLVGFNQGADKGKKENFTFKPEEIFYLPWNRIADETHGISTIEKLETLILKKKEGMEVMQKIVRRNAKPIVIIEADTDNTAKMTELKTQYKDLIENDEAMIVPKDSIKLLDFASKLGIDFLPWLSYIDKEFLMAEGVPEVILGAISSKDTESATKIIYLAFEQIVKNRQNFFEEQWKAQIGFEIDLPEPPSIDPMVLADSRKSGSMDASKGNQNMSSDGPMNPTGQNK